MELREGYKQTEVGVIPEDWNVKPISEISSSGKLSSGIYKDKKLYGKGTPIIKLGDVFRDDYYNPQLAQKVLLSSDELRLYRIESGDIILALASVKLEGVGKGMLVGSLNEDTVFDHNVALLRTDEKFNNKYIHYIFKTNYFRELVASNATQVGTTFLKASSILKFKIPLPSTITEQRAIATALSDMDALLEGLDQLITKKRDLKQATMQQLLTGKTRLPGFCAGMHLSGDAMDGKELVEGEWEVKRLGDVFHFQNGTALEKFFNHHDGLEVVSIGNYSPSGKFVKTGSFISHNLRNEVEKFVLKKNELAMILNDKTAVGSIIGRVLLIDKDNHYVFNQRTMRLSCKKGIVPLFAYHLINSDMVHKKIVLAAKPGTQIYINTDDVLTLELTLPSTEEQTAIATILSDMDAEIEALQQRRNKTRDLKQAMMQELLTGRTRLVEFGDQANG